MTTTAKLTVAVQGDREIVMTRSFDAPRNLVWDAWTKPELLKRWLTGPSPWELGVCEIDLKVGGRARYVWHNPKTGADMGMGGVYREIVRPERVVATEKFDDAWYTGEAVGTVTLTEKNGRTTVKQTLLYESRETRDAVAKSPMESGVAISYDKLEAVLASMPQAKGA